DTPKKEILQNLHKEVVQKGNSPKANLISPFRDGHVFGIDTNPRKF
ncbi:7017_t:CDS:1, partial [Diversispora eburnea]